MDPSADVCLPAPLLFIAPDAYVMHLPSLCGGGQMAQIHNNDSKSLFFSVIKTAFVGPYDKYY